MDKSFSNILRYFQLPERSTEDVVHFVIVILFIIAVILAIELIKNYMGNSGVRRAMRKSARLRGLGDEDIAFLVSNVKAIGRVMPIKVFSDLKEFHKAFSPLMHDLVYRQETDAEARETLHRIFEIRRKIFGEVNYHFETLSTTLQLAIGQYIHLELEYQGENVSLSSRVVDVDADAITVINPRWNGIRLEIDSFCPVKVSFYRNNDGEYTFNTRNLKDTETDSRFIFLEHTREIEKVKMMNYYRVKEQLLFNFKRYCWDNKLDNRFYPEDEERAQECEGFIHNISGGGMMFSTNESVQQNDILGFKLILDKGQVIPDLLGKVVKVVDMPNKEGWKFAELRFVNIKYDEQEMIAQMVVGRKKQSEDTVQED